MAKKKKEDGSDALSLQEVNNLIFKKYGDVVKTGNKVFENINNLRTLSVSPALDLALGGGFREGSMIIITSDPKAGKEQPLSSIVFCENGPKFMGDIEIGDKVCTPDGGLANVIGVFPQGKKDVYRITFSDGTYAECGLDHIWNVSKNDSRLKDSYRNMTLREIIKEGIKYSDRNKFKIKITEPLNFECKEKLEIDPYILGCLLGDGGLTNKTPVITTADEYIFKKFQKYCELNNLEIKRKGKSKYDYAIVKKEFLKNNPLKKALVDLMLYGKNSKNKFIPKKYKLSSINDRFELIRGLMDTDGYRYGANAEYGTTSMRLCEDVDFILKSLGFITHVSERYTDYDKNYNNNKRFKSYRISIKGNNIDSLFSLERKRLGNNRSKNKIFKTIKDIKFVRKDECQCIQIDSDEGLYITDGFNITHNTTTALHFASKHQDHKNIIYINTENRLSKQNFEGIKGLKPEKIHVVESDESRILAAEDYLTIIEQYVKLLPDSIIIVDSTSNMIPRDELDGEIKTGIRNSLPRLLSLFCKKVAPHLTKNRTILLMITHNIANTSGMGKSKLSDCGNMIRYQAGTNLEISYTQKWMDNDEQVGQQVFWKINTSNTGGTPGKTAEGWLKYGLGIDENQEMFQIALELGLIKQAGAWFEMSFLSDDSKESVKCQGAKKVLEFMDANPEASEMLYSKVNEMLFS